MHASVRSLAAFTPWSRLARLSGAALACVALCAARPSAQTIALEASLSPIFETTPVVSTAFGRAVASYDVASGLITCSITTTGINGLMAHIHAGNAGVPGPIVVDFGPGTSTWNATLPLPPAQIPALLREGLYVNVHSVPFPGGEIRGQLRVARHFYSLLNGAQQVPPNASGATGRALYVLNQPAGTLTASVLLSGMLSNGTHIHDGAAGVQGPVLFPLAGGPTSFSATTAPLSNGQLIDLLTGGLYVNAHSAAFPLGEIRDQLRIGGLNADGSTLSASVGGKVTLSVQAPAAHAGKLYLLAGSLSGSAPGFLVNGWNVPLVPDAYLNLSLSPNTPPLAGNLGFLNGNAAATASFALAPASPAFLGGLTAQHAAVVIDLAAGAQVVFATNAVPLAFVP
jgi:hypothetical protein